MTALEDRKRALLASATDTNLIETVEVLGDPPYGTDERMAQVWACDELERRYPAVGPALEAWAWDDDPRPYGVVLLETLATLGVTR